MCTDISVRIRSIIIQIPIESTAFSTIIPFTTEFSYTRTRILLSIIDFLISVPITHIFYFIFLICFSVSSSSSILISTLSSIFLHHHGQSSYSDSSFLILMLITTFILFDYKVKSQFGRNIKRAPILALELEASLYKPQQKAPQLAPSFHLPPNKATREPEFRRVQSVK